MATRSTGTGPGGHDVDDHADDLDDLDPAGDGPVDGPAPPPSGPRVRRAAVAAAALLLVGGLGVAAGSAHSASGAAVREHRLLLEHSLHAEALEVGGPGAVSGDTTRVAATAPLSNDGPFDLEVAVTSVSAADVTSGTGYAPQRLRPGASARIPVLVEVVCGRVPTSGDRSTAVPAASSAPAPVAIEARVAVAGEGPRQVQVPLSADDAERFADDLSSACHPDPVGQVSPAWTWLPDGRLRLDLVTDPSASGPIRLRAEATPGLTLTTAPALPLVVAPGQRVDVDLSVSVDCATVGDGSTSGLSVSAADAAGTTSTELAVGANSDGTPFGTDAWLARRITLACG